MEILLVLQLPPVPPCPLRCPFGTNAALFAVHPLFHESYVLYRHLPSPSLAPPPWRSPWLCALSNWYTNHCTLADIRRGGKKPNGKMNAEPTQWQRELCHLVLLRCLLFSRGPCPSSLREDLILSSSRTTFDTNTMGDKRCVRMQRSHCLLSPSLSDRFNHFFRLFCAEA